MQQELDWTSWSSLCRFFAQVLAAPPSGRLARPRTPRRAMLSLRRVAAIAARRPGSRGAARAYHQEVIDHFEKPLNVGSMDKNDPSVGTGLVGAPACGDVMKLQIKIDDDGNIVDAKFKTFGCGSARAPRPLGGRGSLRRGAPAAPRGRRRARTAPGSRRSRRAPSRASGSRAATSTATRSSRTRRSPPTSTCPPSSSTAPCSRRTRSTRPSRTTKRSRRSCPRPRRRPESPPPITTLSFRFDDGAP